MRIDLNGLLCFGKKPGDRLKKCFDALINPAGFFREISRFQPIIRERRIGPADIVYNSMQLVI